MEGGGGGGGLNPDKNSHRYEQNIGVSGRVQSYIIRLRNYVIKTISLSHDNDTEEYDSWKKHNSN